MPLLSSLLHFLPSSFSIPPPAPPPLSRASWSNNGSGFLVVRVVATEYNTCLLTGARKKKSKSNANTSASLSPQQHCRLLRPHRNPQPPTTRRTTRTEKNKKKNTAVCRERLVSSLFLSLSPSPCQRPIAVVIVEEEEEEVGEEEEEEEEEEEAEEDEDGERTPWKAVSPHDEYRTFPSLFFFTQAVSSQEAENRVNSSPPPPTVPLLALDINVGWFGECCGRPSFCVRVLTFDY